MPMRLHEHRKPSRPPGSKPAACALAVLLALAPLGSEAALREMNTDRPDRTESPYTLDPRHLQVEMDALTWTHDEEGAAESDAFGLAITNFKVGLTLRVDLQLVWESALELREALPGYSDSKRTGIGDLTARLKLNLFGNDGGTTALGLMPFVTFPTAQRGFGVSGAEGGLIVPVAFELPGDWDAGAMLEMDIVHDDSGESLLTDWIASFTASHAIAGALRGYAELYSESLAQAGAPWRGTADAGLTFGIGDSFQLDAGANIGLSPASDDYTVFAGLSFRI